MEISNKYLTAKFDSKTGYLKSIQLQGDKESRKVSVSFVSYGVRQESGPAGGFSTSGAYLFMPDGPAKPLQTYGNSTIILINGPVRQSLFVYSKSPVKILHRVDLDASSKSLSMRNLVDITEQMDFELAMRLDTGKNQPLNDFYTELNGYQMIRRRIVKNQPIQAHFYPMCDSAFVESHQERVFDVVLDRRFSFDDVKGLLEPMQDNRLTEKVDIRFQNSLLKSPLPLDIHLVALRTSSSSAKKPLPSAALILHRLGSECRFSEVVGQKWSQQENMTFNQIFKYQRRKYRMPL
uniref:Glycosyl hydrolase family 38 C-terminal domain-containing protein n=1 Tax=Ditylenchus dipsaci TaxID=166011 RepID=A0A915D9X1_9BILA